MPQTQRYSAVLTGRDEIHLTLELDGEKILSSRLHGVGCQPLLKLLQEWRSKIKGSVSGLELPSSDGHEQVLLREVLLKAKGHFKIPYEEAELCHCRMVPLAVVDAAIVAGAHTVEDVGRATTAGTQCGTCRSDIEKILSYRLKARTS